jgi:hypothetical protein
MTCVTGISFTDRFEALPPPGDRQRLGRQSHSMGARGLPEMSYRQLGAASFRMLWCELSMAL